MLFDRNIEPNCTYCIRYVKIDNERGLCERKGPVEPWFHCRRFRYDPLKRIPPEKQTAIAAYEAPKEDDDK